MVVQKRDLPIHLGKGTKPYWENGNNMRPYFKSSKKINLASIETNADTVFSACCLFLFYMHVIFKM